MILRDYQREAIDRVRERLAHRPVLVSPTGSGKTLMAATLVREIGRRTLWLAHRRELISQAAERLRALGLRCGTIQAGDVYYPEMPVQVASVQTLVRRAAPFADLVVIDEAHHARAGTYRKILGAYPDTPTVGLTATPFRLDGRGLGDIFGEIVIAAWTDELCAAGTLVDPVVYAPDLPSMRGVRMQVGEYNPTGAFQAMRGKITGHITRTWLDRAQGKRTVAFAVNVEHSREIVAAFRARGVAAEHLDGSMSVPERDAVLARLRDGRTRIVSQCMVLTEGWDLPALEVAIIARPTASLCLHLQTIGRIMRVADGKAGAIVLDHAGNHLRHGRVTDRWTVTLDDQVRVVGTERVEGEPRMRRCPACYLVVDPGTAECPSCGHVFRTQTPGVEGSGELVEFRGAPRAAAGWPERAAWYAREEERRAALGYKPGWVAVRYRETFGDWPLVVGGRLVNPQESTDEQRRAVFVELVEKGRARGYKPGWVAHQYKARFGAWPPWRWMSRKESA